MTKTEATTVKEATKLQADNLLKAFNSFLAERAEFKGLNVKSFKLTADNTNNCITVCKNVKDPKTGKFTVVCTQVC
ncbi:hypothetical protein GCM10027299_39620 [Larkinella ripae]